MSYPFDRRHYRLRFPLRERPRLLLDAGEREVVDCSEGGLRYRAARGEAPAPGTPLSGRVRFRRGREVEIVGEVVRVMRGEVAVRFTAAGIPMAVMFDEQRFLRARYPMLP